MSCTSETSKIIISKSNNLSGEVCISGSKNSALPILASCLLTKGVNILHSIPLLSDINIMYEILKNIGAKIAFKKDIVEIDCSDIKSFEAPYELVSKMRGSFLLAGSLLAKYSRARICMPGGCPIGTRPVDLHLKGFAAMGSEISQGHGYIDLYAEKLHGAKIYLDFPSVGATENIIMAASLADGTTIIENAAAEPEIEDLAAFLNKRGAKIRGAGSDTIKITGVDELSGSEHKIIPDRIEAGTFMAALAITRGKGKIKNVKIDHLRPMLAKLKEMNVEISEEKNSVVIDACRDLVSTDIKTMPFPGFPTDMQAQFSGLLSTAAGTGVIIETVFENRFLHIGELQRMGANIKIDGRTSIVEGVPCLTGANVKATDLRGGAALVLAGLAAHGTTIITEAQHIHRGYENLVLKLSQLGANIYEEK